MFEKIISLDKELFVFLNSLGSPAFDGFWLFITKQTHWIPLFLLLLYLAYKKITPKQLLLLVLFVAFIVLFTDQTTNVFKNNICRLRPCSDPEIQHYIRIVKDSATYSFFSGHASNTTAVAVFLFLFMRDKYKYFWLIFLWPLIFSYSRIYLGLHFPLDIIGGYIWGSIIGFLMYLLFDFLWKKQSSISN